MELRHLRYFVAVAEELSFRKGAQRLNVSRPALSKQVKDLETEIGVRLLERDTVTVSLTKAGENFLRDSQAILAQAELAVQQAKEAQSGLRGCLRIGSPGTIATDFLAGALKIFKQHSPSVDIVFLGMSPAEQLAALARGEIDIGFAYGKEVAGIAHLRSFSIVQSTYGVAISKQHPLASQKRITLDQVRQETLLYLGDSTHGDTISSIYRGEGIEPMEMLQVDCCDVLKTLIAAEQGISLLPEVLDFTSQQIVIVPLQTAQAVQEFNMWVVWQGLNPGPHVQRFIRLLEERVQGDSSALLLKIG